MASNVEEKTDTGETDKAVDSSSQEPTLSKSQLKKLKKKEKWQQVKAQKRKAEKERYKARKRACRERGEELGPTRKQLRHNKMSLSKCKVTAVIDCGFDDYMADKDIKMLVKQIQFSYSANRRAENPLQFYCCGVSGKTRDRLEDLGDYRGWDIRFRSESYSAMFDKSSLVYLSSESPNILQTLDDDKVYVIGGLVDHNHHKGLCHRLAEEQGITHAQLPIADHIDMKTRKVLTINHVFEILLHYTETKDWQKAIYTVLPPRKGAVPKPATETSSSKHDDNTDNNADNRASDSDDDSGSECEDKTDHSAKTCVDTDRLNAVDDHVGSEDKHCENGINSEGSQHGDAAADSVDNSSAINRETVTKTNDESKPMIENTGNS